MEVRIPDGLMWEVRGYQTAARHAREQDDSTKELAELRAIDRWVSHLLNLNKKG